ncbi:MAG: M42 family metallopeptidase [Firmicutes bacterium]|nr:M42 family metallopeptidase [Bacillota bacterium]
MKEMQTELGYILATMREIIEIDSPTGFCSTVADKVIEIVREMGYSVRKTNKGSVEIDIKGENCGETTKKLVGIASHLDTLGAVVRAVDDSGGIKFSTVGGLNLATCDGEYCRIYTRDGRFYTGTFLSNHASVHVYSDAKTLARDAANMYIRLDEKLKTAQDVHNLGVENGDFIALDTKFTVTDSGFVKSRFLDDKASVAVILAALKTLSDKKQKPKYDTRVILTVYEEVGHGAASCGEGLSEVLAIDMGCVGGDLKGDEYNVSICAQDASGPYDYEFTSRLINLAKKHEIGYVVDVFPFYASDVSAMLRGGRDVKGALIGSGIHASHGMERAHVDGLLGTYRLVMAYLTD